MKYVYFCILYIFEICSPYFPEFQSQKMFFNLPVTSVTLWEADKMVPRLILVNALSTCKAALIWGDSSSMFSSVFRVLKMLLELKKTFSFFFLLTLSESFHFCSCRKVRTYFSSAGFHSQTPTSAIVLPFLPNSQVEQIFQAKLQFSLITSRRPSLLLLWTWIDLFPDAG